jgi:hypothetical protein
MSNVALRSLVLVILQSVAGCAAEMDAPQADDVDQIDSDSAELKAASSPLTATSSSSVTCIDQDHASATFSWSATVSSGPIEVDAWFTLDGDLLDSSGLITKESFQRTSARSRSSFVSGTRTDTFVPGTIHSYWACFQQVGSADGKMVCAAQTVILPTCL